jgi:hypothetical protein
MSDFEAELSTVLRRFLKKYLSKNNKGNAKRGVSPRLKIRPCDFDLWPWKSIGSRFF